MQQPENVFKEKENSMGQIENTKNRNNSSTESHVTLRGDIKFIFNSGFFGSAVLEDEGFLKIVEEFDYSGNEAAKALQFAAACMNYLMGGLS